MYFKTSRTISVKGKIENLILFYKVKLLSLIQAEKRQVIFLYDGTGFIE